MTPSAAPRHRDERGLEVRRLKAVEGFQAGDALTDIARRLSVSRQAVHVWSRRYRRAGLSGLRRRPRSGRPPKLTPPQRARLARWLTRDAAAYGFPTPVWTTQRVADLVWRRFRVRYDRDHVGRLLRSLGFSWQKATGRARERDEVAIARWVKYTWPRLKKTPVG